VGKKRQFHCLDGVLRDMLAATTDDDGEGWDRLVSFVKIIADIIDILDDDDDSGLPDPEGASGGQLELDMDVRDSGNGVPLVRPVKGHDSLLHEGLGIPPGVGDPMERVRHLARSAAGLEQVPGGVPGVVRRAPPMAPADVGTSAVIRRRS